MRTTLNIDDDVLTVARALAERNGCSLGSAVSELARRGFKGMDAVEKDNVIPVVRVSADAGPITSEDVYKELDDAGYAERDADGFRLWKDGTARP